MKYFDKTFWQMALGFAIIVMIGILGIYGLEKLLGY